MGLVSLAIVAAIALPDGEAMQPSTAWNLDYAENSCVLSRSYGIGDQAISLGLIPQTGGGRMKIVLMAKDPHRFVGGRGVAALTLDTSSAKREGDYFSVLDPRLGRIALVNSIRTDFADLGQAHTLTVTLRGVSLAFEVPQMAGALRALETCETDLAKSWGFDFSLIAEKPVPVHPEQWVRNEDYPKGALFTNTSGITEFHVTIDTAGKPVSCLVTQTSGAADLDTRACEVMMTRARFAPGKDKDGHPIQSMWASAIRWETGSQTRGL